MSPLAQYQALLGRMIHAAQEGAPLPPDCEPGLRFTIAVQRAWCEGRAARAAALTLGLLPEAMRRDLLDAYVAGGGGRASLFVTEARQILGFLAPRLRAGSHAAAMCRLQQALLAADELAAGFTPLLAPLYWPVDAVAALAPGAALIWFRGPPLAVLQAAASGATPPPEADPAQPLLVAPGLPLRLRPASLAEAALLDRLPMPAALLPRRELADLVAVGAVGIQQG